MSGNFFVPDALPVDLNVSDTCGGGPPLVESLPNGFGFERGWILSGRPGSQCVVTVRVTSFQGVEAVGEVVVQLF